MKNDLLLNIEKVVIFSTVCMNKHYMFEEIFSQTLQKLESKNS